MNHRVKTTPDQRADLEPTAPPARNHYPPEDWSKEEHKDQRPKKRSVFWELIPSLTLSSKHGEIVAI